ncbi:SDR family NAD(P)-dependent oxidoreductase [uncultured Reyranella sp.]|uniref:SDR family NAD(P)-dependent oxidoreductase n=1 Tax=uncultured Reyranella sp. TaxID=735512 RepID=UPI0025E7C960|nr:SDR family NAD(P)-dependent oxidoreductase [uncultured Reyranella sp.]
MTVLHLVTGGTSGIGLELVRLLLADPATRVIVGARRPAAAGALRAVADGERLDILPLDLASLASTIAFADEVVARLAGKRLASLAANAGIQSVGGKRMTVDGYEETLQANWLAHALLIERLLPVLAAGAPVVFTASGTHDPANGAARLFGFRGGVYPGIDRVARGDLDARASEKQLGLDRYATSKLVAILHVYARARSMPEGGPRWFAYDPGLMPGTGLARDRSAMERWAWSTILPVVARAIPGASTPRRSAATYARLLTGRLFPQETGVHLDFSGLRTESSADSKRRDWQDEVAAFAGAISQAWRPAVAEMASR